jgi:magnesium chelatase family protein
MIQRSSVFSATVRGVDGEVVLVEVLIDSGLPGTSILGLPDSSVRESRDRVKAAIHSSGFDFPNGKVLVNLAPAHTRKEGPWFDLPIALAILAAHGVLPKVNFNDAIFVGELALDGTIRPVRGILSIALAARHNMFSRLYIAQGAAAVASLVDGIAIHAVPNLRTLTQLLTGGVAPPARFVRGRFAKSRASSVALGTAPSESQSTNGAVSFCKATESKKDQNDSPGDEERLEDVVGQSVAKRALMIAAAGGHNLLFVGTPGSGKSMLAQRLAGLLPPPTRDELLDITKIHDLLVPGGELRTRRPFRAPHHTTSRAGLVGGGPELRPGEISLAHRGVLFLDEIAEFPRESLDALRQPLEEGRITLSRAAGTVSYPAAMQLIAAMNPCPCGWKGHPTRHCVCLPRDLTRYQVRVSGPLLDRIDLFVAVPPVSQDDITNAEATARRNESKANEVESDPCNVIGDGDGGDDDDDDGDGNVKDDGNDKPPPRKPLTSAEARAIVHRCRDIQSARGLLNSQLRGKSLDHYCCIGGRARQLLSSAMETLGMSMRGRCRTLRVARTIADVEGKEAIAWEHVNEALSYRLISDAASAISAQ